MAPLVKCQPVGLGDPRTHVKKWGTAKHPCNPRVSEVNTGRSRSLLASQPSELAHSMLVRILSQGIRWRAGERAQRIRVRVMHT